MTIAYSVYVTDLKTLRRLRERVERNRNLLGNDLADEFLKDLDLLKRSAEMVRKD